MSAGVAGLSVAVEAYAASHGLTVEQAIAEMQAGAEVLAGTRPIAFVDAHEAAALKWIAARENEPWDWTQRDLAKAVGVKNPSLFFRRLRARGLVIKGRRTVQIDSWVARTDITVVPAQPRAKPVGVPRKPRAKKKAEAAPAVPAELPAVS